MTRRPPRWLAALVAAVGLSLAGIALGVSAASDHIDAPLATGIVGAWIGVSFLGVGLFAWYRRPSQHTGLLMIGVSYVWLLSGLNGANDSLPATIGSYLSPFYVLLVIQLIAEFPNRPLDRTMRVLLGAGYVTVFLLRLPAFLFTSDLYDGTCSERLPVERVPRVVEHDARRRGELPLARGRRADRRRRELAHAAAPSRGAPDGAP